MKLNNPWYDKTNPCSVPEFTTHGILFENGDYQIHEHRYKSFLYTYKGKTICQLAGINKQLVEDLKDGFCSVENSFLFDRAMENVKVIDNE